jgi:hypothetical protein
MVPDLPDIGWREPPSGAVFGGISLVHEATGITTSAAYPSPAPVAASATREPARAIGSDGHTLLDRMQFAFYENQHNDVWAQTQPARRISCDK